MRQRLEGEHDSPRSLLPIQVVWTPGSRGWTAAGGPSRSRSYLSGSDRKFIEGMAVDGRGRVWVTGLTDSEDLATDDAIQPVYSGGDLDVLLGLLEPSTLR